VAHFAAQRVSAALDCCCCFTFFFFFFFPFTRHFISFWSVKTGELMKDLSDIHDGQVTSVEFSKDGTLVATASRDNTVKITDMRTYRVLHELQGSSRGKHTLLLRQLDASAVRCLDCMNPPHLYPLILLLSTASLQFPIAT
jgi:WD40 repeat protein